MNKTIRKIFVLILCVFAILLPTMPIIIEYFKILFEPQDAKIYHRYIYAIPKTNIFMHTYFAYDSLYVYIGKDTTKEHSSNFKLKYIPNLTAIVMEVGNDSLVYLVDNNNEIKNVKNNNNMIIEKIENGYNNSMFYDRQYTEDSCVFYVFKRQRFESIYIYSGRVFVNDSIIPPLFDKYEQ